MQKSSACTEVQESQGEIIQLSRLGKKAFITIIKEVRVAIKSEGFVAICEWGRIDDKIKENNPSIVLSCRKWLNFLL